MTDEHPFNQQTNADSFDQERENQILAQIEAERTTKPGAPTSLFLLMLAPLLLIVFPLLLLWFLRPAPAPNTAAAPQTTTTLSQTAPATSGATAIGWQTSLDAALALSKQTGKPIMADFYADWCGPCKMLDEQTWVDPTVVQEAQNVIAVKVDVDAAPNAAAAQRYNIGSIPCIVWIDSTGNEKGRSVGFSGPQEMLALMQQHR